MKEKFVFISRKKFWMKLAIVRIYIEFILSWIYLFEYLEIGKSKNID